MTSVIMFCLFFCYPTECLLHQIFSLPAGRLLSQSVCFSRADWPRSGQTSLARPHSSLALYVHLLRLCKL